MALHVLSLVLQFQGQVPWVLGLGPALEAAFEALHPSDVVADSFIEELFFDAVVEPPNVTFQGRPLPEGQQITIQDHLPMEFENADFFSTQMSTWETPAIAWGVAMPLELRGAIEGVTSERCHDLCKRRGELFGGSNCCEPRHWCTWLHEKLCNAVARAAAKYRSQYDAFGERLQQSLNSLWPFGQSVLLSYFVAASQIPEQLVNLLGLIFSHHSSNPALHACIDTEWGHELRNSLMGVLELMKQLQRTKNNIFWELGATSRYGGGNTWVSIGLQASPLQSGWQDISNCIVIVKRTLDFLTLRLGELGEQLFAPLGGQVSELRPEKDGEYATLELRRSIFLEDDQFFDKPALRFLIRNVFKPDDTVGEFGAFKGLYSSWLNDTGLVQAFAYDGIAGVSELTDGQVQELQLGEEVHLGRRFDWILSFEVGEHLPKELQDTFVANIRRHALRGAVISWATPDFPSVHHPNTMMEEESTKLIERHGFRQDKALTAKLRSTAALSWLQQTAAVYFTVDGS